MVAPPDLLSEKLSPDDWKTAERRGRELADELGEVAVEILKPDVDPGAIDGAAIVDESFTPRQHAALFIALGILLGRVTARQWPPKHIELIELLNSWVLATRRKNSSEALRLLWEAHSAPVHH